MGRKRGKTTVPWIGNTHEKKSKAKHYSYHIYPPHEQGLGSLSVDSSFSTFFPSEITDLHHFGAEIFVDDRGVGDEKNRTCRPR